MHEADLVSPSREELEAAWCWDPAFDAAAIDAFGARSEFAELWLEHLLLLSMLQHEGGRWTWGRYLVLHPATNPDMTGLVAR